MLDRVAGLTTSIALAAIAWGSACAACVAADDGPTAPAEAAAPTYCIESLSRMDDCQLEAIYRQAEAGPIPDGSMAGRAIYSTCEPHRARKTRVARFLWRGKVFDVNCGTMINQWIGFRAIRSKVYYGPGWLDGKPSIILDYTGTSRVWADVRDEFREVSPGVYLGIAYLRRCPPQFKTFFALEVPACACVPGP